MTQMLMLNSGSGTKLTMKVGMILFQLCFYVMTQLVIVFTAESFHTFVSLVSEFPSLKEKSQFVFVPGPRDPGPGPILPR